MESMEALLRSLLQRGLQDGCYPGGVAAVGCRDEVFAKAAVGSLWAPDGPAVNLDTRYDMASCSKIIGPTMLALQALEAGLITLDDTVGRYLEAPADRRDITVRQLMTHTAGLVPSVILENEIDDPAQAIPYILSLPLAGEPGIPRYTCFGYMVLTAMLEKAYGEKLDVLVRRQVFEPLGMVNSCYNPTGGNIAATEVDPKTGKAWIGVVHDENARFLHGVSGNAGVFSDIHDMTRFAQMLSKLGDGFLAENTLRKAIRNYTPGHDVHRGLGFHLGGTECNYLGDLMPAHSFGHTGFTGTSVAIEPDSGFFVVLLTNRVNPTRENGKHLRHRRLVHNALYTAYLKGLR